MRYTRPPTESTFPSDPSSPRFYNELLRLTGLESDWTQAEQMSPPGWPDKKEKLAALFKSKTRDAWCEIMEGSDVCFAPVLSMSEAPKHPHNQEHGTFVEAFGQVQPAPGPRFSRTPGEISRPSAYPGQHTDEVLAEWGFSGDEISQLRDAKAIA